MADKFMGRYGHLFKLYYCRPCPYMLFSSSMRPPMKALIILSHFILIFEEGCFAYLSGCLNSDFIINMSNQYDI